MQWSSVIGANIIDSTDDFLRLNVNTFGIGKEMFGIPSRNVNLVGSKTNQRDAQRVCQSRKVSNEFLGWDETLCQTSRDSQVSYKGHSAKDSVSILKLYKQLIFSHTTSIQPYTLIRHIVDLIFSVYIDSSSFI